MIPLTRNNYYQLTCQKVNDESTHQILPRQNVNFNSNSNQGPGTTGTSNSYSYSSSNGNGRSQSSVNYNLNGVSVPQPLTGFQPGTIENACGQYLGSNGGNQNPETP